GQYSPTSAVGQRSPSTPYGALDYPVLPAHVALGAGARFVARAIDTVQKPLAELLKATHEHRGASFLEILQNCPVFNDNVFVTLTDKASAPTHQLWVQHGKPLRFGAQQELGLRLDPVR